MTGGLHMRTKNIRALENLGMFCHFSGIVSIILGFLIIGIDVINKDYSNIQIGIFIIAIGYAFVKIAAKLTTII